MNRNSSYNRPMKNKIRVKYQQYLLNTLDNRHHTNMLVLDTAEYLFSKVFTKQVTIYNPQLDKKEYDKMIASRRWNCIPIKMNVNKYVKTIRNFDVIYLDYCGLYRTNRKGTLEAISNIKSGGYFLATYALRRPCEFFESSKKEALKILKNINKNTDRKLLLVDKDIYKDNEGKIDMFTFMIKVI